MLQSWEVVGSIPEEVVGYLCWCNPTSHTVALGSTKPLTEMNTRNLPGDKWRPAHKADKLIVICEPIVKKMWEPRRPVTGIALLLFYHKEVR
jgi:hypothetical protein